MVEERESMSPTKIGFGILWPACWTGIPIKAVIAVIAMTMGLVHFEGRFGLAFLMLLTSPVTVFAAPIIMAIFETHFGEGIGLPLLFGASIPIDIWALGVVGQTFFLDMNEGHEEMRRHVIGFQLDRFVQKVYGSFILTF